MWFREVMTCQMSCRLSIGDLKFRHSDTWPSFISPSLYSNLISVLKTLLLLRCYRDIGIEENFSDNMFITY